LTGAFNHIICVGRVNTLKGDRSLTSFEAVLGMPSQKKLISANMSKDIAYISQNQVRLNVDSGELEGCETEKSFTEVRSSLQKTLTNVADNYS
jgi:hypothetical protein